MIKLFFDTNIYISAFVISYSKADAIMSLLPKMVFAGTLFRFLLTMKNNSLGNRPIAGDKQMLRLKYFKGIRIMSLREYLDERGKI